MGSYFKIGWEIAVQDPKSCWRHLELLPHFEVLKKKSFYNIFFMDWWFKIQSFKWLRWKLTELWNICVWRPFWISLSFWRLPKCVIRSTLNLIAHEMTIALPLHQVHRIESPLNVKPTGDKQKKNLKTIFSVQP
jgi:hypothetical protein